uniref:Uncharacterized protein n=1 Tax=Aegilops tauschii subsp. strangulata TaxID=200361 RepID=A0A453MBR9_AEGTS
MCSSAAAPGQEQASQGGGRLQACLRGARVPDGQGAPAGLRRRAGHGLLRRVPRPCEGRHHALRPHPAPRQRQEDAGVVRGSVRTAAAQQGPWLRRKAAGRRQEEAALTDDAGAAGGAEPAAGRVQGHRRLPASQRCRRAQAPVLPALRPVRPAALPGLPARPAPAVVRRVPAVRGGGGARRGPRPPELVHKRQLRVAGVPGQDRAGARREDEPPLVIYDVLTGSQQSAPINSLFSLSF